MLKYVLLGLLIIVSFKGFAGNDIVISKEKPFTVYRNVNAKDYNSNEWDVVPKEMIKDFPDCEGKYIDTIFGTYYEIDDDRKKEIDQLYLNNKDNKNQKKENKKMSDFNINNINGKIGNVVAKGDEIVTVRNINMNNYSEKIWNKIEHDIPNVPDKYLKWDNGELVEMTEKEKSDKDKLISDNVKTNYFKENQSKFFGEILPENAWTQNNVFTSSDFLAPSIQSQFLTWLIEGKNNAYKQTHVDWEEYINRKPNLTGGDVF